MSKSPLTKRILRTLGMLGCLIGYFALMGVVSWLICETRYGPPVCLGLIAAFLILMCWWIAKDDIPKD
jgi:hypothetical protein